MLRTVPAPHSRAFGRPSTTLPLALGAGCFLARLCEYTGIMLPTEFSCYCVTKDAAGHVSGRITTRPLDELPPGDVLVRVVYSSLNYKDALAVKGHPGVTKKYPHVPGVDAAGVVAESGVYEFVEGDRVLVTGFDMGADRWGGYGEYVRVPQDWLVPLPAGLSLEESMTIGTAGFTAALSIDALQRHGVEPGEHEVVVTGASGGVGSMAVDILAKLGYRVAAVSGKPAAREFLTTLGARGSSRANSPTTAATGRSCTGIGPARWTRSAAISWRRFSARPATAVA